MAQVSAEGLDRFFKNSEAFKRAHVGICILNLEAEEEVYAFHEEQFFVPASLQKIPLSVTAFSVLGNDFCFQTTLAYEGIIDEEGVLHGNLLVQGGGDPTLPLTIFDEWEACLKNHGVHSIEGKIIVDTSVFETAMASPFGTLKI
jgi:D-alanyl-D-alanine carboxypeptidase/D-alanyl-D-alanine-endopeptidase (penicillin-binding protein 4)